MSQVPDEIFREAADPAIEQARLFQIASEYPGAYAVIAANPQAYPELLEWLGRVGDPFTQAVLRQRAEGRTGADAYEAARAAYADQAGAAGATGVADTADAATEALTADASETPHEDAAAEAPAQNDAPDDQPTQATPIAEDSQPTQLTPVTPSDSDATQAYQPQQAKPDWPRIESANAPAGGEDAQRTTAMAQESAVPQRRSVMSRGDAYEPTPTPQQGMPAAYAPTTNAQPQPGGYYPAPYQQQPYQQPPQNEEKKGVSKLIVLLIILALIALAAIGTIGYMVTRQNTTKDASSTEQTTQTMQQQQPQQSEDEETSSTPTETQYPAPADAVHSSTFHMPSGNINCAIGDDNTRCTIANKDFGDCGSDVLTVTLSDSGVTTSCGASGAVTSPGVGPLLYNTSTTSGNYACTSNTAGIQCWDVRTGEGFDLAKESLNGIHK
ncbi:MAG: hypothetical protein E7A62_08570 [Actinomycetaceae bacterium]|nr:hypothetical protein [Actinomycetaceae bacterium]MDU0971029.1 hypothetical protein [Actinomycetaceae bacterium]